MIYRELTEQEYKDAEDRILYEDNHLLVVDKRAGEIVQADMTRDETISDLYKSFIALRDSKPGSVFVGIPPRLDRPVSGIVVLAKTSKALSRLNAMFRDGQVHKFYWALVCAAPPEDAGELSCYLVRNEQQNKSYVFRGDPSRRKDAKLAKRRYWLKDTTDRYYLIAVELHTERHPQIRCKLADMGCCIKGDLKYGDPR